MRGDLVYTRTVRSSSELQKIMQAFDELDKPYTVVKKVTVQRNNQNGPEENSIVGPYEWPISEWTITEG